MSLFIAVLLIYNFDMPAWMYAVAAIVWLARHAFSFWMDASLSDDIMKRMRVWQSQ
jgi:hypothetical protein